MNNKKLFKFLEIIFKEYSVCNEISEIMLRKNFKNNEYYNIKKYCLDNNLIELSYHKYTLTNLGLGFFNFLKKLKYL